MNLNKEQENRLQAVVFEMQETLDDLLDKGLFALTELIETIGKSTQADMSEECSLYKMTIRADITKDYILQAQKAIEDIIARENRSQADKDCIAESRQEIIQRVQTVKNPELIEKILTFVKCWMDDEGGITDERR